MTDSRITPLGTYFDPPTPSVLAKLRVIALAFVTGVGVGRLTMASFVLVRLPSDRMKVTALGSVGDIADALAYLLTIDRGPSVGQHVAAAVAKLRPAALDALDDLFENAPPEIKRFAQTTTTAERMRRGGALAAPWAVVSHGRTMQVQARVRRTEIEA